MEPIHTKRLLLRDLEATDVQAIHRVISDPEVIRYIPFGTNAEDETRHLLLETMAGQQDEPGTQHAFAVIQTAEDALIGNCMIRISSIRNRDGEIWATCDPETVASGRVLEKIGMTREGLLREHVFMQGS
jgi:RimJ/RimL family protein N-acetyltransferase